MREVWIRHRGLHLKLTSGILPAFCSPASVQRSWDVSGEGGAHSALYGTEYLALVTKLDFSFRRVHVHVKERRLQANIDDANRMPPHHEEGMVRFLDGVRQHPAGDRPVVDE